MTPAQEEARTLLVDPAGGVTPPVPDPGQAARREARLQERLAQVRGAWKSAGIVERRHRAPRPSGRMGKRREAILDELLVLAAREGGRGAFEALVERWQERLWRHARRLTGRSDAAWDVLQETWIAIRRGLSKLEDPARFRAWAYQVVTRRVADWRRREGRVPTQALPEVEPAAALPDETRAAVVDRLRRALRRLEPDDRALLALRYVDELSGVEVGRVLDIPAGTVRSRLFHARQKLRAVLERMEDDE